MFGIANAATWGPLASFILRAPCLGMSVGSLWHPMNLAMKPLSAPYLGCT